MAKKLKRAIKKAAKVALPMLAIAGLGKAFMNNRAKNFTNADARKLMTSNAAMRNSMMQNPMVTAEDLMKLNEGTDFGLGPLDMKKGGRVKKTKGFSKTKKKQANRSKKK